MVSELCWGNSFLAVISPALHVMLPVPRRTYFSYKYCPHESKAASHCFLFSQPPSRHAPLPPQHVYCVEWCSFASLGCPQDDSLLGPLLSNTLCKGAHTLKTSHTLRKQGPLQLALNLLLPQLLTAVPQSLPAGTAQVRPKGTSVSPWSHFLTLLSNVVIYQIFIILFTNKD